MQMHLSIKQKFLKIKEWLKIMNYAHSEYRNESMVKNKIKRQFSLYIYVNNCILR